MFFPRSQCIPWTPHIHSTAWQSHDRQIDAQTEIERPSGIFLLLMMWSFESDTRNRNQIFNFYYVRASSTVSFQSSSSSSSYFFSSAFFMPFRMCTYKLGILKIKKKSEAEYSPERLIHSHSCTRQAAKCKAPQRLFFSLFGFPLM